MGLFRMILFYTMGFVFHYGFCNRFELVLELVLFYTIGSVFH